MESYKHSLEPLVRKLQLQLKEKDVIINKMGGNICELEAKVEQKNGVINKLADCQWDLEVEVNDLKKLKAERDTLMETLIDDVADLRYIVTEAGTKPEKLPRRMYANYLRFNTKLSEEEIQLKLQSCNN